MDGNKSWLAFTPNLWGAGLFLGQSGAGMITGPGVGDEEKERRNILGHLKSLT
jgi:hypothetical protein